MDPDSGFKAGSGSAKNLSGSETLIMMTPYLPGRVLGPVGGDGGGEFLSMLLLPGVDIRNMHLDGIQACAVVVLLIVVCEHSKALKWKQNYKISFILLYNL